jgi:hypothetical protein
MIHVRATVFKNPGVQKTWGDSERRKDEMLKPD